MQFGMSRLVGFFIAIFCTLSSQETKFLLLTGPSGAGKSTVIRELEKIDSRFVYIKPFTTRALREGEKDKISVSLEEIQRLQEEKRLVALNYLYGNYYATPLDPIVESLEKGYFPVIDWPIEKVEHMKEQFGERVFSIFLFLGEEELCKRLDIDNRDPSKERFLSGREELRKFAEGKYCDLIDLSISSEESSEKVAERVYHSYLNCLG